MYVITLVNIFALLCVVVLVLVWSHSGSDPDKRLVCIVGILGCAPCSIGCWLTAASLG